MLLKNLEIVAKIKKNKKNKEFESKLFMKFEKLPTFKIFQKSKHFELYEILMQKFKKSAIFLKF